MALNTRRYRLLGLLAIIAALGLALALVLYALRDNINLYHTPSEVALGHVKDKQDFRLGGLVVKGSVKRAPNNLAVEFVLTDRKYDVTVQYEGILPDLFREGQGIVTSGQLNAQGIFVAKEVLAKHDENYMPPVVKDSLEAAARS